MRRSLRFWQKTYLVTLLVFVVALNGGFAFAGIRCYDVLFQGELDQALSDQRMIAQNLERDIAVALESGNERKAYAVAFAYDVQFGGDDLLDVMLGESDEDHFYSSQKYSLGNLRLFVNPDNPANQRTQRTRFRNGEEYIVVAGSLSGTVEGLQVNWAHSLTEFNENWSNIRTQFLAISVIATMVGALGLLSGLRSLSRPLAALARTSDEYAAGDTEVRATARGADEISELAASFNNLADTVDARMSDLQRAADMNARMAASLSHEVRTPLTAIRGYAEYLQFANATPEEKQDALGYIIRESKRLQNLSQRMMQLFSLENGELEKQPVDMVAVVQQAFATIEPKARERDVSLSLKCGENDKVCAEGDELLLESLIANLLDNAVNACEPGGQVRVGMSVGVEGCSSAQMPCGNVFVVEITDTGRGMKAADLERLGEPFYRPDKARSRALGGAGLGVSIAERIVRLHGGLLEFESAEAVGTRVRAIIPSNAPDEAVEK